MKTCQNAEKINNLLIWKIEIQGNRKSRLNPKNKQTCYLTGKIQIEGENRKLVKALKINKLLVWREKIKTRQNAENKQPLGLTETIELWSWKASCQRRPVEFSHENKPKAFVLKTETQTTTWRQYFCFDWIKKQTARDFFCITCIWLASSKSTSWESQSQFEIENIVKWNTWPRPILKNYSIMHNPVKSTFSVTDRDRQKDQHESKVLLNIYLAIEDLSR